MYYMSPSSNLTPALVSVAMSRSDSRDSNYSTMSTNTEHYRFTSAPMTVSYSSSPSSYRLNRSISNTSSSDSAVSSRRPSSTLQRHDSMSTWIPSPYRSCQVQGYDEPSSYLSDDDLLYIAPPSAQPREQPLERKELSTEEQIAMLRDMQDKEQQDMILAQQQRRQAAAAAQKAVRFTDNKPRRSSQLRRKGTTVRKGTNGSQ